MSPSETTSHFNGLTPAEAERIAMLLEEAGEIVQACGKILRHGYRSHNPHDRSTGDNRQQLAKEVRDLEAVLDLMKFHNDFAGTSVEMIATIRNRKLRYTHHQGKEGQ